MDTLIAYANMLIAYAPAGIAIRTWVARGSFVKNPLYGHRDCRRVLRIMRPATVELYESPKRSAPCRGLVKGFRLRTHAMIDPRQKKAVNCATVSRT
jgi:hypothetical protein